MTAILLIGASGTGKSAIAAELDSIGWTTADLDALVAQSVNMSVQDVVVDLDVQRRHELEHSILGELLDDVERHPDERWAIAVSSDALGNSTDATCGRELRQRIATLAERGSAVVVGLHADLGKLVTRNGLMGPRSVSLIMPRREFRTMLEKRQPLYDSLATHNVDTSTTSPREAAETILLEIQA